MQSPVTVPIDNLLRPMRSAIDELLDEITSPKEGCPDRLTQAIRYSVLSPGKRVRPILTLVACEAISGSWREALPAACAVELVHVYSLIHDDLPCMDDDEMRRGKPTCHVQFDQATACLAGDSLQMLAIETLCDRLPAAAAVSCCQILSKAAGRCRLVGGQMDDLAAEGRFSENLDRTDIQSDSSDPLDRLKQIHLRKTGALIEASLQMGGVVGGADVQTLGRLEAFGGAIGLAFQVVDDCLDVESTRDILGKTPQKDSQQGKMTYPGLLGLAASRQYARELVEQACASLEILGESAAKLMMLAQFIQDRKY
jgi:geranylgeranyl diphosphate synthase type II